MPVITSFDLSAIAWVKGGEVRANIPERQLLTNSYTAMQPAPEIIEKVQSHSRSIGKRRKDYKRRGCVAKSRSSDPKRALD